MWILRFFAWALASAVLLGIVGLVGAGYIVWQYSQDLPDYQALASYQPPVTTRVHAGNGELIGEFARERRLFVPIDEIPQKVIDAFIAAEDKNFYSHPGVDFTGIARAVMQNAQNLGQSKRPVGASTITQQVAKNMLLGNEVSIRRKIREAVLAFRLESALSKRRILELYLNEIYLGWSAYGVAAAAINYFDKSLDELSIGEAAFLAVLPKAPANYSPDRFMDRAKDRRNYVLDRMVDDGFITADQGKLAAAQPIVTRSRREVAVKLDWFSEEVRRQLAAKYGEKALYEGGLSVRTTMDPTLQAAAQMAVRNGMIAYDRHHGWRGPFTTIDTGAGWPERLASAPVPLGLLDSWRVALVLGTTPQAAEIGFVDGTKGQIPMEELRWARKTLEDQEVGPVPQKPADVLKAGDVVAVEQVKGTTYGLRQIPNVGAALVAMDPHTGRVLALVGGWDFKSSQFIRATQAERQPGSSFKPFVYAAALDSGFTPSSLVLDAPFVYDQGPGLPKWKPKNYSGDFLGPTTLRVGLEKSRNLMTVRLAQAIGMEKVVEYAYRLGAVDKMGSNLAMSLGAGEVTPIKLTSAYAKFVNGGKDFEPTLIDRIQDRTGKTVYKHDRRPCPGCDADFTGGNPPTIPDDRQQVLDPMTAYQIVAMLQGVVDRGTGVRLREVGKILAGKTGTSNDSFDNWFVGFSPDFVAGVFVGFDNPRTLGAKETGSSSALPIFKEFITIALKDKPSVPFRIPPGVSLVRVDPATGLAAAPGDKRAILEPFKPGTEPTMQREVLDGSEGMDVSTVDILSGKAISAGESATAGTGGLY